MDIEVVKQDKITVILFVLETRNSVKLVPFKNALFERKGEKPLFSLPTIIKCASIVVHLLKTLSKHHLEKS